MCYKHKHIKIEKYAYLPDLIGTHSLYLPNWNSFLPNGSLIGSFCRWYIIPFLRIIVCSSYTQKHIKIGKYACLPDLVGIGRLCLPDWNSYLSRGSFVSGFCHPDVIVPLFQLYANNFYLNNTLEENIFKMVNIQIN